MTIEQFVKQNTKILFDNSIPTARLDTLVLLEYALSIDKAELLANPGYELSPSQQKVLNKLVLTRATHLPISYITHNKEFYGRNFFINKYVLEPRPESETMIDCLKTILNANKSLKTKSKITAADIGTGCGAIGITAMLEIPNMAVDLIDTSLQAIKVAKRNVVLHTISTSVIKGNLLFNNVVNYDILMCNLPYVPDDFRINLAASHEPKIAIFGGADGLDIYRRLFKLVKNRQHKPLYIITESLPTQHAKLSEIAKDSNYVLEVVDDFINVYKLA